MATIPQSQPCCLLSVHDMIRVESDRDGIPPTSRLDNDMGNKNPVALESKTGQKTCLDHCNCLAQLRYDMVTFPHKQPHYLCLA